MQAVEALSAGQHVPEEKLVLLGQLPDASHGQFHSVLRSILLPMRSDPVMALLTLRESQQQEASLEELFEQAEIEDNAEVGVEFKFRSIVRVDGYVLTKNRRLE